MNASFSLSINSELLLLPIWHTQDLSSVLYSDKIVHNVSDMEMEGDGVRAFKTRFKIISVHDELTITVYQRLSKEQQQGVIRANGGASLRSFTEEDFIFQYAELCEHGKMNYTFAELINPKYRQALYYSVVLQNKTIDMTKYGKLIIQRLRHNLQNLIRMMQTEAQEMLYFSYQRLNEMAQYMFDNLDLQHQTGYQCYNGYFNTVGQQLFRQVPVHQKNTKRVVIDTKSQGIFSFFDGCAPSSTVHHQDDVQGAAAVPQAPQSRYAAQYLAVDIYYFSNQVFSQKFVEKFSDSAQMLPQQKVVRVVSKEPFRVSFGYESYNITQLKNEFEALLNWNTHQQIISHLAARDTRVVVFASPIVAQIVVNTIASHARFSYLLDSRVAPECDGLQSGDCLLQFAQPLTDNQLRWSQDVDGEAVLALHAQQDGQTCHCGRHQHQTPALGAELQFINSSFDHYHVSAFLSSRHGCLVVDLQNRLTYEIPRVPGVPRDVRALLRLSRRVFSQCRREAIRAGGALRFLAGGAQAKQRQLLRRLCGLLDGVR